MFVLTISRVSISNKHMFLLFCYVCFLVLYFCMFYLFCVFVMFTLRFGLGRSGCRSVEEAHAVASRSL